MMNFENENIPTKEVFHVSEIDERVVIRKPIIASLFKSTCNIERF